MINYELKYLLILGLIVVHF